MHLALRNRALAFFGIAVLAAVSMMVAVAPAHAATEHTVSGDVTADFATIQAAVDAAEPGDTINVAAGTYDEDVTVPADKPLSLFGANAEFVTVEGSFDVSSPVIIQGFTIRPLDEEPATSEATYGIRVASGGAGSAIANNTFENATNHIIVRDAIATAGNATEIVGNHFSKHYNNAVSLQNSAHVNVTGNTVINNADDTENGYGVNSTSSSHVVIDDNILQGLWNAVIITQATGVVPATNVTVTDNVISDIAYSAIVVGNANIENLTISGNYISDYGLEHGLSSAVQFGVNPFHADADAPGLESVTIDNNTFTGGPYGVRFSAEARVVDNHSVVIDDNTFSGITAYAIWISEDADYTVTATDNDFGGADNEGPVEVVVTDDDDDNGNDNGNGDDNGTETPTFSDVTESHPFYTEISWLASTGIAEGYDDGTYGPQVRVSRQAIAAFLSRYLGAEDFDVPTEPTFSDVGTDHPFFAEIEWLAESGITTGYEDGTFRPGDRVSRQAVSAFFYRMSDEADFVAPGTATFPDVSTSHEFYTEIEWLASTGITTGYQEGSFQPTRGLSRQAIAAFFYRYDELVS